MTSPYQRIALAGATGNLGPTILQALVSADFTVTVLSRSPEVKDLPQGVKLIQVDYTSQESLIDALRGQDAVVSNLPSHFDQQPKLIDAAIAAGVKLFLPSEFGSDVNGNEKAAGLPVFAGKVATEKYLIAKSKEISWTAVVNGPFLDWCINVGFLLNTKGGPVRIFDGGNRKFSATTLADVGKAVVAVLRNPEQTKNRAVYVQSATVSQNQILEIATTKYPDLRDKIEHVQTADLERESYDELKRGGEHIAKAMVGFILSAIFGEIGSNWDKTNDNELLGIQELSGTALESLILKSL